MSETLKVCDQGCGKEFTEAESRGPTCYGCKLTGLSFAWKGGGGRTQKDFHTGTNAEICRQTEANAKRNGYDMTPVPRRAILV